MRGERSSRRTRDTSHRHPDHAVHQVRSTTGTTTTHHSNSTIIKASAAHCDAARALTLERAIASAPSIQTISRQQKAHSQPLSRTPRTIKSKWFYHSEERWSSGNPEHDRVDSWRRCCRHARPRQKGRSSHATHTQTAQRHAGDVREVSVWFRALRLASFPEFPTGDDVSPNRQHVGTRPAPCCASPRHW
jgi:hypothetical protein